MSGGPRLARLLLRARLDGERAREVIADLDELFERRAGHGRGYACRRYWADALSFLRTAGAADRPAASPDQRSSFMSTLTFDLKQVVRAVRRQPAFFAVACVTLAVGFAAHLAAYNIVDRMLLAGPPHVQNADRIVRMHIDRNDRQVARFLWFQTPYRSFDDLRKAGVFEMISGYRAATASVNSGAEARQVSVVFADHDYFPLLGGSPRLGRVFGAEEDTAPAGMPVAVLADGFWRGAFGADPGVLGRTVRIGTIDYAIIGVMPRSFTGDGFEPVDLWIPWHAGAYELPAEWGTSYLYRSITVLGRLPAGATASSIADRVSAAYRRSVEGTPAADPTAFAVLGGLLPGRTQRGELNPAGKIAVWIEGVAILVLLVAVANVVNLQMSRGAQRRRELAVRVALGANRARLLLQLGFEMLFIAGVAAVAGGFLTWATATTLHQLLLPNAVDAVNLPRLAMVGAVTALVTATLCTLLSSFQVTTAGIGERLKSGRGGDGFSRERLRQGLLVAQVVVSALLLVGAGLFLRSIDQLGRLNFGHDQDRVLVVTMPLRGAGYAPPAIEALYERALRELQAVPGVENVAAAQSTPFAPSQAAVIALPGVEGPPLPPDRGATFYTVTPRFFDTMGMKVLRGRGFTDGDNASAPPVMVMEESLAQALWPGQDPIGKCLLVGSVNPRCREVVGVVTNTRRFVTTGNGALRYYLPMAQRLFTMTPQALFVRATGQPAAAMPSVRSALLAIDPNLPFVRMRTLVEMAEPEKRPWRMGSTLLVVFGAAALLVATAGVYALLSFMVTQRSREIGVRLALGASRARTLSLVVRQSLTWVVSGLVLGLCVAGALGKQVQPMLFETSPYDPTVFAGAAALLAVVALGASLIPAWRASRVDPNVALRME